MRFVSWTGKCWGFSANVVLLANDSLLRKQLGEKGRVYVEQVLIEIQLPKIFIKF